MGDWTFFGIVVLLGALAIGAILLCVDDEPATRRKKQEASVIAEAQAVATAANDELDEKCVLAEVERILGLRKEMSE